MSKADDYHGDFSRDSNSSLRLFEKSIELYHAIRVAQTTEPDEPTPAMLQGTLADQYTLEPETFFDRVLVAPPDVTRRHNAFEMLEIANRGKIIITSLERLVLVGIRDGVMRNTKARQIIEAEGDVQRVIEWDCPETGCPLKLMEDKITSSGLLMNMKVTGDIDPDTWSRQVLNFDYHCQAALYLDGAIQAGLHEPAIVWVVVSRNPPHECACYMPDEAAITLGRRRNAATIKELMDRRARNDWRGRWSDSIHTLSLPRYAFN